MTAFLYISYSRGLSEEDRLIIDKSVFENREAVCRFVINIPYNVKDKSKRLIIVISLATLVCFSVLESTHAIGLPMPPAPVVRVQPSFEDSLKNPDIAKLIPPKPDRISYKYFSKSKEELLLLISATDPRLGSNQEVLKLVKELRGGSCGIVGTAIFLGLIILIFSIGEGFVPNNQNPGWGLNRPNPFQPPTAEHRYPPYYDLFLPKRTCYADRPGGSQIMAGVNPQSSREELTQLSTDVVPTQTQMSGFVRNGKVDLHQCLDEVNRRASEIGCTDFECSLERFKALATENGKVTNTTAREAITILQGEMQGYYRNAVREDYGLNVKGPDFIEEFNKDEKYGGFPYKLDKNGNPILRVETKTGSEVLMTYDQALEKYYHQDVYNLETPKNFDSKEAKALEPKDRVEYLKKTVPRDKVIEFQIANAKSLSTENFLEVPGFIGAQKEPGTLYINKETGQIHFVNDRTNIWRTTVIKSPNGLINLAKNDFHLFPNAGKK